MRAHRFYIEIARNSISIQGNKLSINNRETILEGDCAIGLDRMKVVLTNTSLIFFQKIGVFRTKYKKIEETPLEEIKECYVSSGAFSGGTMQIVRKDGKKLEVSFGADTSSLLLGDYAEIQGSAKSKSERWVNAINLAKAKLGHDETDPLQLLKIRYAKGEISKTEYEEMKKVLEAE
jgi:hypothetical protein